MLFTPEDLIILSSIKLHPNSSELEQLNELIPLVQDWDYLIHTLIDRGIAPLFYTKLSLLPNSSVIPETVKTKLQQAYYKTVSRSALLYEHFRKIAEAFVAQNIPVIGLKGIYLSEWLYQDIGLRQFSDIDLFVIEEDALTCISILTTMGYKKSEASLSEFILSEFEKDTIHYPAMVLNGVSIELHIKLHSKLEKYNLDVPELWKNALPATINGVKVQALNTTDLLIHLCLHLDKHFKLGHVQFTCFNDVTNLLEKYSDTLNWKTFIETCKLYNCEEVVFKYLVMVHTYMNASVPADIIQKYSMLLTEKDEQLFCGYLSGNPELSITLSAHVGYLKNVTSLSDKVRYLRDILFPSKAFMIARYQIHRPRLALFYYPYRYWIGVRGMVNHFFSSKQ
jgi:Uncharacterised nucleotidyltransferase